jgi:hypothetical protein
VNSAIFAKKKDMLRLIGIALIGCFFVLASCAGTSKQSNEDLLLENVKSYFFLDDSISVQVVVADTIHADEVEEMLATIEKNLNLIDQDLDTLSLMIDDKAYKKLGYEQALEKTILIGKNKYKDSLNWAENALLDLRLKQSILSSKREGFKQTNRVLLHFKRSIWANIAGYNVIVDYTIGDAPMHFDLVTDANYTIVD